MTRIRCALTKSARSARRRRQEEVAEYFAPLAKWLGGSLQNSGRWFDSNKVLKKLKNKFIFFLHGPMGVLTWGIVKTRRASTGKQGEQEVALRGWGTDPTPNYKTGYHLSLVILKTHIIL